MGRPPRHTEPVDLVFQALAHPGRRTLLATLGARDGRTLQELTDELPYTRQAVAQHLLVLEEAGIVSTRRHGREKLHFLNAVPLLDAYSSVMAPLITREARRLVELRETLERAGASRTEHRKPA